MATLRTPRAAVTAPIAAFVALAGLLPACGEDFQGYLEEADAGAPRDGAVAVDSGADSGKPPSPADSGAPVTDAGTPPRDAGPPPPRDAGGPTYKWACSSQVGYYGNQQTGNAYASKNACEQAAPNYCDVTAQGDVCDANAYPQTTPHFLCGDCVQSRQGGWLIPAQRCACILP